MFMVDIDFEILSVILFFCIVALLLIKDRKNVEFKWGIIIRKWKRGKEIIDTFAKKHEKAIKLIGTIGVVISILASIYAFIYLFQCLAFPELRGKCFAIVLPRVEKVEYPENLPIVSPRFWPWIVSIFLLVIVHELMHAIFIRVENVKLKNYGLIFLLLLPLGAFVDPDSNQIRKLDFIKKLRIYAAGSFGNFIFAGVIFVFSLIANFTIYNLLNLAYPYGVEVVPINNTPACEVNLTGVILKIDGNEVKDVSELMSVLEKVKPGQNLTIETSKGVYNVKTVEHPEKEGRGYIGIRVLGPAMKWKSETIRMVVDILFTFLFWIFALNLGIGLFNLLPLKPLDGGLIFEEISNKIFKDKGRIVATIVSILTLSLLLTNLLAGIVYYQPPQKIQLCK
jgi:membrane-associated protease RseP (regulator of RpoE activity)